MKFIRKYAYAGALAIVLSEAGWSYSTWQFYVAFILISILVSWSQTEEW